MILGIQIIGALFGLFMVYYTFLHYKRKEFTVKEFSFWVFLWALFIIVSLAPSLLDPFVKSLELARAMDLLVILGFMFLIGALPYTYILVRNLQKKMEEVVRKIALEKK